MEINLREELSRRYSCECVSILDVLKGVRSTMKRIKLSEILHVAKRKEKILIVGAGQMGQFFLAYFRKNGLEPIAFLDNNEQKHGTVLNGIEICKPQKMQGDCLYVVSVVNFEIAEQLFSQLLEMGIAESDIIALPDRTDIYKYRSSLREDEYQDELDIIYFESLGKMMNWTNPQTYNEKVNWEKLYLKDARKTKLADKYLVRDYVKEKIGDQYLTKLYDVWDNVEDIDFQELPQKFVLKTNNGSGRNIIVKDKGRIQEKTVKEQLEKWLKSNFAYASFEMQYKDIKPRVICEEYLEGVADNLYDYDIYCFHGEPRYIWCINGSHTEHCKASFYDLEWNKQPFSYGYPIDDEMAPRPENLDKMIELSRILAKDFEHVRVDWYQYPNSINGILFSEMTFSTWGGINRFRPEEYDLILGQMI